MENPNLREWILEAVGDEPVEAVVFGHVGGYKRSWNGPDPHADLLGRVLTWDEAAPILDRRFSPGYGAPEAHSVVAYTATRIVSVYQYDGATGPFVVQRHPVPHEPEMPGG